MKKELMNKGKEEITKVDITPTWATVTEIFITWLENPKASAEAKSDAKSELRRLAKSMDEIIKRESNN